MDQQPTLVQVVLWYQQNGSIGSGTYYTPGSGTVGTGPYFTPGQGGPSYSGIPIGSAIVPPGFGLPHRSQLSTQWSRWTQLPSDWFWWTQLSRRQPMEVLVTQALALSDLAFQEAVLAAWLSRRWSWRPRLPRRWSWRTRIPWEVVLADLAFQEVVLVALADLAFQEVVLVAPGGPGFPGGGPGGPGYPSGGPGGPGYPGGGPGGHGPPFPMVQSPFASGNMPGRVVKRAPFEPKRRWDGKQDTFLLAKTQLDSWLIQTHLSYVLERFFQEVYKAILWSMDLSAHANS